MNVGTITGIVGKNSVRTSPANGEPTVLEFNICFQEKNSKGENEYNFFRAKLYGANRIRKVFDAGFTESVKVCFTYKLRSEKYKETTQFFLLISEIYVVSNANYNATAYQNQQQMEEYKNTWENGIDIEDSDILPF